MHNLWTPSRYAYDIYADKLQKKYRKIISSSPATAELMRFLSGTELFGVPGTGHYLKSAEKNQKKRNALGNANTQAENFPRKSFGSVLIHPIAVHVPLHLENIEYNQRYLWQHRKFDSYFFHHYEEVCLCRTVPVSRFRNYVACLAYRIS